MLVARFHDFADGRRPFEAALNAGAGVANEGDNLVGILFEHSPERDLEALRFAILVNSISGEYGQLAT